MYKWFYFKINFSYCKQFCTELSGTKKYVKNQRGTIVNKRKFNDYKKYIVPSTSFSLYFVTGNLSTVPGKDLSLDLWENFVSNMGYPDVADYDENSISFFKPQVTYILSIDIIFLYLKICLFNI